MPGVRMGIKKENRGILSKSLSNGKGVDRRIMTELDANKKAEELLKGAYDLHVHSSPSVFPRELDGFQLIREADAAGMAGVMLKSHYESTALRAELINRYSGCKAKAYGGLCLNCPAGGLNVYAVKNALRAGAKIVWMPTRDAKNSLVFGNMEGDFFDRQGYYHSGTGWNIKRMRLRHHGCYQGKRRISGNRTYQPGGIPDFMQGRTETGGQYDFDTSRVSKDEDRKRRSGGTGEAGGCD